MEFSIWKDKLFKKKRFAPYTTRFRGHPLYIHDRASFWLGYHELFKEETYKFSSSKTNPYIIDCGANLGMSIIYFKSLFPQARILAFEADPGIFGFLEKNMHSFHFKDITIFNKAVWDTNNELLTFMNEGGAGGRIQAKNDAFSVVETKTARLSEFITEKIDFLKIDIEGAEGKVIADCADKLYWVENLFIEYHSFEKEDQNLHQILGTVQQAGFRYHIKEAYTSPFPFMQRKLNVGMDLQLNIFCYRT